MKVYKKLMNALAAVEKVVLVVTTLLILVLTVGNVFSRKVIHRSWSFTEELVVAVFCTYYTSGSSIVLQRGWPGQPDTGYRPSSEKTGKTICDPDHSTEYYFFSDSF